METGLGQAEPPIARWRIGILVGSAVVAVALAWLLPRIPQDPGYLDFADQREFLGVPNALNVLSNAPFAVVGAVGLLLLRRGRIRFRDDRERRPWATFLAGVALTSMGSAYFHWTPSFSSLVFDRLPMSVAFMGLVCALAAERVDPSAALRLLGPLVLVGIGTVLYWYASERALRGDLGPYLVLQYYSLVLVLLVLVLFPPAYSGTAGWLVGLGAYAAAKWAEAADRRIYAALRVASGHTVKHLLAAAGIAVLLVTVARRRPVARIVP